MTGVLHFRIEAPTNIHEFLLSHGFAREQIAHFLHHGCIYANGVRQRQNHPLSEQDVVRLHTRPKQYSWTEGPLQVLHTNADFVVLDKPSGLPVHATLDNFVQNAKYLLEQQLGQPLYSTHRLDIPTRGLLLLARHPRAQSLINKLFAERRVTKIYRALSSASAPLGEHVLYLDPTGRVPRPHALTPQKGWWECRLRVLECEPTPDGWQSTIQLLTGRTHQIRAQFAALACPIVGDTLYGGVEGPFQLECHSLAFVWRGQEFSITRPPSITSR